MSKKLRGALVLNHGVVLEILDKKKSFRRRLGTIKPEKMRRINYEKLGDDEKPSGPFKLPVVFKYTPNKERSIQQVFLVGTFSEWKDKVAMAKNNGEFVTIVDLAEGEHQYKFVVDGNWEHDPNQVRN